MNKVNHKDNNYWPYLEHEGGEPSDQMTSIYEDNETQQLVD